MQAPLMVGIGDSIIGGWTNHHTFIEVADVTDIPTTVAVSVASR